MTLYVICVHFFIHNITQKFGTIVYFVKIPYKHRNTGMGTKLIRMTELVPTATLPPWTMATPRPILYRHSNPKNADALKGDPRTWKWRGT